MQVGGDEARQWKLVKQRGSKQSDGPLTQHQYAFSDQWSGIVNQGNCGFRVGQEDGILRRNVLRHSHQTVRRRNVGRGMRLKGKDQAVLPASVDPRTELEPHVPPRSTQTASDTGARE